MSWTPPLASHSGKPAGCLAPLEPQALILQTWPSSTSTHPCTCPAPTKILAEDPALGSEEHLICPEIRTYFFPVNPTAAPPPQLSGPHAGWSSPPTPHLMLLLKPPPPLGPYPVNAPRLPSSQGGISPLPFLIAHCGIRGQGVAEYGVRGPRGRGGTEAR